MLVLKGSREKMYGQIFGAGQENEVQIKTKPSKQIFLRLLNQTKVNKISMSEGINRTVPQKVKRALEAAGIEIIIVKKRAGRPQKFSMEKKMLAQELLQSGEKAKDISEKVGVPTTAIYFWKRKMGAEVKFGRVLDST
ncbi:MAG: hypothetical protein WC492_02380 [Candidatus Micrarchaeia archaeon]